MEGEGEEDERRDAQAGMEKGRSGTEETREEMERSNSIP